MVYNYVYVVFSAFSLFVTSHSADGTYCLFYATDGIHTGGLTLRWWYVLSLLCHWWYSYRGSHTALVVPTVGLIPLMVHTADLVSLMVHTVCLIPLMVTYLWSHIADGTYRGSHTTDGTCRWSHTADGYIPWVSYTADGIDRGSHTADGTCCLSHTSDGRELPSVGELPSARYRHTAGGLPSTSYLGELPRQVTYSETAVA